MTLAKAGNLLISTNEHQNVLLTVILFALIAITLQPYCCLGSKDEAHPVKPPRSVHWTTPPNGLGFL